MIGSIKRFTTDKRVSDWLATQDDVKSAYQDIGNQYNDFTDALFYAQSKDILKPILVSDINTDVFKDTINEYSEYLIETLKTDGLPINSKEEITWIMKIKNKIKKQ